MPVEYVPLKLPLSKSRSAATASSTVAARVSAAKRGRLQRGIGFPEVRVEAVGAEAEGLEAGRRLSGDSATTSASPRARAINASISILPAGSDVGRSAHTPEISR